MDIKEVYEKLNSLLCNQSKALKELVWTIDRNQKLVKPKNVLLVGELGSGKTTMVEQTAEMMNLPVASVSGFCTSRGIVPIVMYDAITKLFLKNNRQSCRGIILVQDMKDVFLLGGLQTLSSLITSSTYTYENHFYDISDTMFIGEVDINGFTDCFIEKPVYSLENIDEAIYSLDGDDVKNIIDDLTSVAGEVNNAEELYYDRYRKAMRRDFWSIECQKIFNKKIFLDTMGVDSIKKALESPVSELQIYSEDLCDDYMRSEHFINSLAFHICESLSGLHDLDKAVRDVTALDSKRKVNVFKANSLMRF